MRVLEMCLFLALTVSFTMPRTYFNGDPLPVRYYKWQIGYQHQSLVWQDSVRVNGPAWGQDVANFGKWKGDAAMVPWEGTLGTGWAMPGDSVTVTVPPVMSIHWPFWVRARAWTDVPGAWSNPSNAQTGN